MLLVGIFSLALLQNCKKDSSPTPVTPPPIVLANNVIADLGGLRITMTYSTSGTPTEDLDLYVYRNPYASVINPVAAGETGGGTEAVETIPTNTNITDGDHSVVVRYRNNMGDYNKAQTYTLTFKGIKDGKTSGVNGSFGANLPVASSGYFGSQRENITLLKKAGNTYTIN